MAARIAKTATPAVASTVAAIPLSTTVDGVKFSFKSLDDKSATDKIKNIHKTGAKLRKDIHETAIGLIMHMIDNGRHTKFIDLANAIGDTLGMNQKKAFQEWVLAYTWLVINPDTKIFDKDKSKVNKLEDAMNMPFWKMEKAPNTEPFDFQKAFEQLMKRAEKAIENKTFKGDETKLLAVKAAMSSVSSAPVTTVEKVAEKAERVEA